MNDDTDSKQQRLCDSAEFSAIMDGSLHETEREQQIAEQMVSLPHGVVAEVWAHLLAMGAREAVPMSTSKAALLEPYLRFGKEPS